MTAPRRIGAIALVLGVTGCVILLPCRDTARAADVDASKLVGKWVYTKANGGEGEPQAYLAYEFTQKGAMTRSIGRDSYKGTYKVKGDKLTIRFSIRGKAATTEIITIKKVEDDVLVIIPEMPKLELEFKKEKK